MQLGNPTNIRFIFGGTFDPPHWGHIKPLSALADQFRLTQIELMPCHVPVHKGKPSAQPQQRIAMLEKVCEIDSRFVLNTTELNNNKPSYTVDTLQDLQLQTAKQHIVFIIGTDSYNQLTTWSRWQHLFNLCHLLVLPRGGQALQNIALPEQVIYQTISSTSADDVSLCKARWQNLPAGTVTHCQIPEVAISSSEIKLALKHKQDVSHMMPATVLDYIRQHRLYID